MGSLGSVYVSRKDEELIDYLDRLAAAKGLSKNKLIMNILREYRENNKRYSDRKITDFEVKEVEKIIKETPVYCKECFSKETDDSGFVIHDWGCSFNLLYYTKDDEID